MDLLQFHKPLRGTLEKRYKRFFADVRLDDGSMVTAHCTNTGSMKGVCLPGAPVILSSATNPDRKLRFTWEATQTPDLKGNGWIGVNTSNPNRLVAEALKSGLIPGFDRRLIIKPEYKINAKSRLDFALFAPGEQAEQSKGPLAYIEVKNVTLAERLGREKNLSAYFPDSVSERATKHIEELILLKKESAKSNKPARTVVIYVLQRPDCDRVLPAAHIDEMYSQACERAKKAGVEFIGLRFLVHEKGIRFGGVC
jgi:sugar fermentation stimulation protein A